jgi:hypothetical protein
MRVWRDNLGHLVAATLLSLMACSHEAPTPVSDERPRGEEWTPPSCAFYGEAQARTEAPEPIREASGLAVDPWDPTIFWTHNDSGGLPALYAFDTDGTLRHTLTLVGLMANDWEALAVGPCRGTWCLYVGDIGDNLRMRREIRVHRVPIPSLDLNRSSAEPETMRLVWPEGARNAEAMAVWPDETVVILSKETNIARVGARVFGTTPNGPATLEVLGELTLRQWVNTAQATGLDVTQDGRRAVMRLYTHVVVIKDIDSPADLATAAARAVTAPPELQGEAVAWTPSGYATLGEGAEATLYEVGCE